MSDRSKCNDVDCPARKRCYRYTAPDDGQWQTYADFQRPPEAGQCASFIDDEE